MKSYILESYPTQPNVLLARNQSIMPRDAVATAVAAAAAAAAGVATT